MKDTIKEKNQKKYMENITSDTGFISRIIRTLKTQQ